MAAVAGTNKTSGTAGVGSTATTASITPTNNLFYLLSVFAVDVGGLDRTPTATHAGGLSWVQVAHKAGSSGNNLTVFRAMKSSGLSAGTCGIDFGGNNQGVICWSIDEFSGTNTTGTDGSGAVVQSASNSSAAATSLTVTLAAFGSLSNATFGAIGHGSNEASTPGSGFTELSEPHAADVSSGGMEVEWRADNATSVDASWTVNIPATGIALEIAVAVANVPVIAGRSPSIRVPRGLANRPRTFLMLGSTSRWDASAGLASGTGAAANASTAIIATAGCATGTGAAGTAAANVQPNAGNAAGTGTAFGASEAIVSTAGNAAGTGAANTAAAKVQPAAGLATGTGAAASASVLTAPGAGLASGTGASYAATPTLAPNSGLASGTGSSGGSSSLLVVPGGLASGTGTAYQAAEAESISAIGAAGTGSAYNATVSLAPSAQTASGTGTAFDAGEMVTPTTTQVGGGPGISGRRGGWTEPADYTDILRDDEELVLIGAL